MVDWEMAMANFLNLGRRFHCNLVGVRNGNAVSSFGADRANKTQM